MDAGFEEMFGEGGHAFVVIGGPFQDGINAVAGGPEDMLGSGVHGIGGALEAADHRLEGASHFGAVVFPFRSLEVFFLVGEQFLMDDGEAIIAFRRGGDVEPGDDKIIPQDPEKDPGGNEPEVADKFRNAEEDREEIELPDS